MDMMKHLIAETNALKIVVFRQTIEVATLRAVCKEQEEKLRVAAEIIEKLRAHLEDAALFMTTIGDPNQRYG